MGLPLGLPARIQTRLISAKITRNSGLSIPSFCNANRAGTDVRHGRSKASFSTSEVTRATGPSAGFGQMLQFITSSKLGELQNQHAAFQEDAKVLEKSANASSSLERARLLLAAVKSWKNCRVMDAEIGGKINISDLQHWIAQAELNSHFNSETLNGLSDIVEQHIKHLLARFEASKLSGNLFNEWLTSGDSAVLKETEATPGRAEHGEQKEKLCSLIFTRPEIDTPAITAYLDELFSSKEAIRELKIVRKQVERKEKKLERSKISEDEVSNAIKGLLRTNLLGAEKREVLQEALLNPTALNEISSVLSMRIGGIDSWKWPKPMVVEMRRQMNGKYRAFSDTELLDTIYLQHIGTYWQENLRELFVRIFKSARLPTSPPFTKKQNARRHHYLGFEYEGSIVKAREGLQLDRFLLAQMRTENGLQTYEGKDSKDKKPPATGYYPSGPIQQELLRIMMAESNFNTSLHGTHAIVRSDFQWFGPSLPHESILTILKFFGASEKWLTFYENFLRMPLHFQDELEGSSRIRLRGVPTSYALSTLFGEAMMFVMDFAVNQRADGLFLYRMHDDLWLWDSKPEKCVAGWKEMRRYASLVGLTFNDSKTGFASLGASPAVNAGLPKGDVRWGLLKLDGSLRFSIDRDLVTKEVEEMRRQLANAKSVLGWVNVWNKYQSFFVRNLGGRPGNCFGLPFLDKMLVELVHIQHQALSNAVQTPLDPTAHLGKMIKERFGVTNLPQGYFFSPLDRGGLALRDSILELLPMQKIIYKRPDEIVSRLKESDVLKYNKLKDRWLSSSSALPAHLSNGWTEEFMSFEEYTAGRESRLTHWGDAYVNSMKVKPTRPTKVTSMVKRAAEGCGKDVKDLTPYERSVASLYSDQLLKQYGSWNIVDPVWIPLAMVQLYKEARLKLDQ